MRPATLGVLVGAAVRPASAPTRRPTLRPWARSYSVQPQPHDTSSAPPLPHLFTASIEGHVHPSFASPPPRSARADATKPIGGGGGSPMLYIFVATAVIGGATYYLFPNPNAASKRARSRLTLEPRQFSTLPLTATEFYPSLSPLSEHKHLQILLPSFSSSSSSSSAPSTSSSSSSSERDRLRIRSIYLKEPALQIERAYTPLYDTLPGSHTQGDHIDLIIKKYADGELGRYAHRLVAGENVEVRGPVETWSYDAHRRIAAEAAGSGTQAQTEACPEVPDEIVMLVGGTGITPAYQLATSLLGRPTSAPARDASRRPAGKTKLTLLYAAPSLRSALLLPQLHALASAHPDRLQVGLFVESLETSAAAAASSQPQPPAPSELFQPTFDRNVHTRLELVPNGAKPAWWQRPLQAVGLVSPPPPAVPPAASELQRWQRSDGPVPSHLLVPADRASSVAASSNDASPSSLPLPLYTSRITPDHIRALAPPPATDGGRARDVVVLVCGPDGMVHRLAGSKARDGVSQGPLAGVLKRLGYREEQVFKL
ncbi:hypothetical protein ACQY0O_007538 [Thecaphora frezii]